MTDYDYKKLEEEFKKMYEPKPKEIEKKDIQSPEEKHRNAVKKSRRENRDAYNDYHKMVQNRDRRLKNYIFEEMYNAEISDNGSTFAYLNSIMTRAGYTDETYERWKRNNNK